MKCPHATREVPTDPHEKARYDWAMKHVELAKEQGMSSEEIHALFKQIMDFDFKEVDKVPNDEAHKTFRQALAHANRAMEEGQPIEAVHAIFRRIMHGETEGKCKHRHGHHHGHGHGEGHHGEGHKCCGKHGHHHNHGDGQPAKEHHGEENL
ncbi:hypothetical protein [Veillonella sp.]|uniref:hypothetical protein n=1 Tax=Veillonella sp. TaxID=1926307 RepID=UPI0025F2D97C|nr:hypothetical protein [Veillonella sp.]